MPGRLREDLASVALKMGDDFETYERDSERGIVRLYQHWERRFVDKINAGTLGNKPCDSNNPIMLALKNVLKSGQKLGEKQTQLYQNKGYVDDKSMKHLIEVYYRCCVMLDDPSDVDNQRQLNNMLPELPGRKSEEWKWMMYFLLWALFIITTVAMMVVGPYVLGLIIPGMAIGMGITSLLHFAPMLVHGINMISHAVMGSLATVAVYLTAFMHAFGIHATVPVVGAAATIAGVGFATKAAVSKMKEDLSLAKAVGALDEAITKEREGKKGPSWP